jgi:hypothetical protein
VARQVILDKLLDLLLIYLRFVCDDVRTRQLVATAIRVRDADDGGVEDLVVREQQSFELRGRDLQTFVLDEFLEAEAPVSLYWFHPKHSKG